MEISNEEKTYEILKKVYQKTLSKSEGIEELVNKVNMKRGSADINIQIFPFFINGLLFKRTLSVSYFDCFLKCILNDFGDEQLAISLSSIKKHIDYAAEQGDSKIKLKYIYNKYLNYISKNQRDEIEQLDIINAFNGKTRFELKQELLNSSVNEDEKILINHKTYKRDNKSIALIKILRNFECQICQSYIIKKDGSKYIEAAHIIPKCDKGKEIAENILLLCPNHHKEFDFGNREIINHTHENIHFRLNGNEYSINLTID